MQAFVEVKRYTNKRGGFLYMITYSVVLVLKGSMDGILETVHISLEFFLIQITVLFSLLRVPLVDGVYI